jgi:hypothetical protein
LQVSHLESSAVSSSSGGICAQKGAHSAVEGTGEREEDRGGEEERGDGGNEDASHGVVRVEVREVSGKTTLSSPPRGAFGPSHKLSGS